MAARVVVVAVEDTGAAAAVVLTSQSLQGWRRCMTRSIRRRRTEIGIASCFP